VTLRARLVAGLVVLVTVGLVAVAATTYFEQRSFLTQRVDDQARAAVGFMGMVLDDDGGGYGNPGGGHGGGPGVNIPPGTYGQLRDESGHVINEKVATYQVDDAPPRPKWPASIAPHTTTTVGSTGSDLKYRVTADDSPNGLVVVAVPLSETTDTLNRLLLVEGLVIGAVVIALAALSWWLVGFGLRPLDRMGDTAGAIAAGDLSRRVTPADERTEVGKLGLALNAMLAQIEQAFAERAASEGRLRRFIADASHELRTPLASIRGYAELFRMGAARDPEGSATAMGRIEDEAARMGVLVEDLLTLARLDQLPDLARDPVDLTVLGGDAADDARAAAPERAIDFRTGDDGPVVALGDASRLRQVIGNLMRNALVHTPAGTPVELTVTREADDAVVSVRDYGPGLPTDDSKVLFERFWRAEEGRRQGPAGAGLGLSIVHAMVTAHGGTVTARNAPGGGALFTVRLPVSVTAQAIPVDGSAA
jgi:two-component system OmpR family sensor kinase